MQLLSRQRQPVAHHAPRKSTLVDAKSTFHDVAPQEWLASRYDDEHLMGIGQLHVDIACQRTSCECERLGGSRCKVGRETESLLADRKYGHGLGSRCLDGDIDWLNIFSRESDRSCVGATKAVPLSRDPDVYYDDAAMPFMSADIDGADKSTEGLRERTPSWAERVMTLDEIDDYLVKHVELRRNVITSRMEIRWFADDIPRGLEPWKELTDYEFNKLWRRMQRIKDVSERHLHQEIESDFSPDFHPFRDYLEHLPPWDGKADHIAILAAGVTVEGSEREQQSFCNCLKRWLVAMIAGWLTEDVVNQTVLVFIGRQGIYKTSWFKLLLPPQLRRYYYPRSNVKKSDKDAYTAMTQYGLIACEELDSMTKGEMNSLKADITTAIFSYRPPYGRYMENHKHIASFCATGNHPKFLNDPTGTRRWLPFKVESILSPWDFPFDHDNIFAQAYALWQGGYQYYFSDVEIEWLNDRNSRFAVANLEKQLVFRYFRKPTENESGELVDTAMALQVISYNVGPKIYPDKVDAAFADLGFEERTVNGMSGYLPRVRT